MLLINKKYKYPIKTIYEWKKEINKEDDYGEASLWNFKWKIIFQSILRNCDLRTNFANRIKVDADGWCISRAITNISNEIDLRAEIAKMLDFVTNSDKWKAILNNEDWIHLEEYHTMKKWNNNVVNVE